MERQSTRQSLWRERNHFARVAGWFAENAPGTPVPDWCFLGWQGNTPFCDDDLLEQSEDAAAKKNDQQCSLDPEARELRWKRIVLILSITAVLFIIASAIYISIISAMLVFVAWVTVTIMKHYGILEDKKKR